MFKLILVLGISISFFGVNASSFIESDDYYISTVQETFLQAYATCKGNGMVLVSPQSTDEESSLDAILKSSGITYALWTGGFYDRNPMFLPYKFVWIESGDELDYSHWGTNEPITPTTADYCIVKSASNSTFQGKWSSSLCGDKNYFACQRKS